MVTLDGERSALALDNEAIRRELEFMEAQLKRAEIEAEVNRKDSRTIGEVKSKLIMIAELFEKRKLEQSKYDATILADFIHSKVKKMQGKNEEMKRMLKI